jgi:zinc protease
MKRLSNVIWLVLALGLSAFAQAPVPSARQTLAKSTAGPATPNADDILNHYVAAVGGAAAWQKVTSRVLTGTIDIPGASLTGTIEVRQKAPHRILTTLWIAGASFRQGYDGTVGWSDDPENGVREQQGGELSDTRRQADFYHALNLRTFYSKFSVVGKEKAGDHSAYVVEATPSEGGDADKMFFDTETGILIRFITKQHTAEGASTSEEDFEDFRDVDGIKLPFTIHHSGTEPEFTIKVEEVHHNVALDDAQFSKPAAQ